MESSTLQWTAATRARVHHFRFAHSKDPDGAHQLLAPQLAWSKLRARTANGKATASPSLESALDRLREEFSRDTPPRFDPAFELFRLGYIVGHCATDRDLRVHSGWSPEREVMSLWSAASASDVLDVLTSAAPFWLETGSEWRDEVTTPVLALRDEPPSIFVEPPPSFRLSQVFAVVERGLWWAYRMQLDALDRAAFDEANAHAHRVRRALAPTAYTERSQIALAFSRDPSHADEERALAADASQSPEYNGPHLCRLLLASAALAQCDELLLPSIAYTAGDLSDIAYDLVETFGVDARATLEAASSSLDGRKMNAQLRNVLKRDLDGARKLLR